MSWTHRLHRGKIWSMKTPELSPPEQRRATGALLVLGPVVYLLGEFTAAAAWTNPPYSYTYHFISNLGVRGPSELFGQFMLSPLAWVMNSAFFLFGIITWCGFVSLRGLSGWRRVLVLTTATMLAVGGVLLALNPGSAEAMEHGSGHALGAMAAFIGGNTLAIAMGRMHQRVGLSTTLGKVLVACGSVGLCAMVGYFADLASGLNLLLGLVERAIVYPFLAGIICIGATAWSRRTSSAH